MPRWSCRRSSPKMRRTTTGPPADSGRAPTSRMEVGTPTASCDSCPCRRTSTPKAVASTSSCGSGVVQEDPDDSSRTDGSPWDANQHTSAPKLRLPEARDQIPSERQKWCSYSFFKKSPQSPTGCSGMSAASCRSTTTQAEEEIPSERGQSVRRHWLQPLGSPGVAEAQSVTSDRDRRSRSSRRSLKRDIAKTFRSGHWLTDESLAWGFSELVLRRLKGQADLVQHMLLVDPAAAFWLSVCDVATKEGIAALRDALGALKIPERRVLLVPINDSNEADMPDSGNHWSLLVGWANGEALAKSGDPPDFNFIHYDSMIGSRRNFARAGILANRLVGGHAHVKPGQCASQSNGFDCGLYVLFFSELIADAYRRAQGKVSTALNIWERHLRCVAPEDVVGYRRRCLDKCIRSAFAVDSEKPASSANGDKPADNAISECSMRVTLRV